MTEAEQTALVRAANGTKVEPELASALISHGYVFQTIWGKLALTEAGVSAMRNLRAAGQS